MLVSRFRVLVPGEPLAVATNRHECVERFVERYAVHRVNVALLRILILLPMTLETEVAAVNLRDVCEIYVHDAAPPLNRADSVALAIAEAGDGTGPES